MFLYTYPSHRFMSVCLNVSFLRSFWWPVPPCAAGRLCLMLALDISLSEDTPCAFTLFHSSGSQPLLLTFGFHKQTEWQLPPVFNCLALPCVVGKRPHSDKWIDTYIFNIVTHIQSSWKRKKKLSAHCTIYHACCGFPDNKLTVSIISSHHKIKVYYL